VLKLSCHLTIGSASGPSSRTPPLVELDAADLPFGRHELASNMVWEMYTENPQEVMMFGYVEWLRGMLEQWRSEEAPPADEYGGGAGSVGDEGGEGEGWEEAAEHVFDPDALEQELAQLAIEQSVADEHRREGAYAENLEGTEEERMEADLVERIVHGKACHGFPIALSYCTHLSVHTRRILLPGLIRRPGYLLIVYQVPLTHSPHPLPWPNTEFALFAHSVPVYACTLAVSSSLA